MTSAVLLIVYHKRLLISDCLRAPACVSKYNQVGLQCSEAGPLSQCSFLFSKLFGVFLVFSECICFCRYDVPKKSQANRLGWFCTQILLSVISTENFVSDCCMEHTTQSLAHVDVRRSAGFSNRGDEMRLIGFCDMSQTRRTDLQRFHMQYLSYAFDWVDMAFANFWSTPKPRYGPCSLLYI